MINELTKEIINIQNLKKSFKTYEKGNPFPFCICDNFLNVKFLNNIVKEFPSYHEKNKWYEYNNPIEVKKTMNDWNKFGKNTYTFFSILNSEYFLNLLKKLSKNKFLYADPGLNGGGLHTHKKGGSLNRHLDYNIHPKINFQRKINFLLYVTNDWKKNYGGELGFWSQKKNEKKPDQLMQKITPKFNRAVFFDTTQNSWHGLVTKVNTPKNICRNSLAVYYLTKTPKKTEQRYKALFSPNKNQEKDKKVLKIIKDRVNLNQVNKVYISN